MKIAGGSQLLDDNGVFNIGKRNYIMLRKIFWKNGILIEAEDIGGSLSRTVRLDVGNLLGVESSDETTEQESNDAVKEFMNVVCGQLVTAAFGTEEVFNLSIPEVMDLQNTPEFEDSEEALEEVATISVEGQLMQLLHKQSD